MQLQQQPLVFVSRETPPSSTLERPPSGVSSPCPLYIFLVFHQQKTEPPAPVRLFPGAAQRTGLFSSVQQWWGWGGDITLMCDIVLWWHHYAHTLVCQHALMCQA